jgi:hypothetical protein
MNQNNSREENNMPSIEHGGEQWIRMVDHIALTHQQLQKARAEALREIIEVRNDRNKSTRELFDLIDKYQSELDQPNT